MATKSFTGIDKPVQVVTLLTDNGDGTSANGLRPATYTQLGYQQIASATLAASTGLTVPTGASTAIVQNNGTQACRWRPDGATTAPTTTVGQRIAAGTQITLDIGNAGLTSSRFIREADVVTLDITYYA